MPAKKAIGNQWNFSVPGYKGKLCKSLSQIDETFRGAKDIEIKMGRNRYRAILCVLGNCPNLFDILNSGDAKDLENLKKARERIKKVTKVFISFDSIEYYLEGNSKPYTYKYANLMPKFENFEKYLNMKYNVTKMKIQKLNNDLSLAKKSNSIEDVNVISQNIKNMCKDYVASFKGRESIVGTGTIFDVFFDGNFSFENLKDIVFINNKDLMKSDYILQLRNSEYCGLLERIITENHLITLDMETLSLSKYVFSLNNQNGQTRKLETIKEVKDIEQLNQKGGTVLYEYKKPLTQQEIKELENIKLYTSKYKETALVCLKLITRMNNLVRDGELIYSSANATEKSLWASYLGFNAIKNSLEYQMQIIKERDNSNSLILNGNKLSLKSLLSNKLGSLDTNINTNIEVSYFLEYVPSYIFDDRHLEKNEKEVTTLKQVKELDKKYTDCYNILISLLELFVGIQMGTLAIYMKRYGLQGMDFSLSLFPSIKNLSIKTTPNITTVAEYCVYKDLKVSAIKSDSKYFETEEGKALLGPFEGFAMVAFNKIAEFTNTDSFVLTHTDKEDSKVEKIGNIFKVLSYVTLLFKEYHTFFHIA